MLFNYMSLLLLYALQLNRNASQGKRSAAPAPHKNQAKPVPLGAGQAPSQSVFLPAPDTVGQNLSRKVRASLDQIRDRSCAPTPRLPYGSYS